MVCGTAATIVIVRISAGASPLSAALRARIAISFCAGSKSAYKTSKGMSGIAAAQTFNRIERQVSASRELGL